MTHYDHPARIMAAEAEIAALKAALQEALNAWASWAYESRTIHEYDESMRRLSKLRAQFLDDK